MNDNVNLADLSPEQKAVLTMWLRKKASKEANQDQNYLSIERASREGRIPLSFAQQRLWFITRLAPETPAYHIQTAVRINGRLNLAALKKALNEVVRRHESLRTSFVEFDGEPSQCISEIASLPLPVFDLSALSEIQREREAACLSKRDFEHLFDLAEGPLIRASLLRFTEEQHAVLLTIHHIISDGVSEGILMREVTTLYQAFVENKPSPLPELPIQYADFAIWQRNWLQGEVLEQQLDYWKKQLEGAPALLELPSDRPRPPVHNYNGGRVRVAIPAALVEELKALSHKNGVTPFMTLLTAFKTLLYRYSHQESICVGTPIAGRGRAEIEGLIGFFVNTLPLCSDLSGNPTFRELLARVCEVALGAYSHQDLPFEKLVDALQIERKLSHNPLFQVLFALQNFKTELKQPGAGLGSIQVENVAAKFDLSVELQEGPRGIVGVMDYDRDLFDASTLQRMAEHFNVLLNSIVANPEQRLNEIDILTSEERNRLLIEWNSTERKFGVDCCVHELVEAQVARTPDAIAVSFEQQRVTYREVNARANRLAHYLKNKGVGLEDVVGICMERSIEMVVALLGVLKAGAAYVPLDPAYPSERLEYMIEDAGVKVVLSHGGLVEDVGLKTEVKVVRVDLEEEEIQQQSDTEPGVKVEAENLAYVIYTSGSTGKPKGAMIPHRALINHMLWMQRQFPLDGNDRVLQKTPFSFDASVWEFYAPLVAGAELVMAREGGHQDTSYLVEAIRERQITVVQMVPTLLSALLEEEDISNCESLRMIYSGGEVLGEELARRCKRELAARLTNLYGPTEAAIDTTYWEYDKSDRGRIEIGKPISNVQVYVLREGLELAGIGIGGEIYIGGDGLGRGYKGRADMTAEKFIPNPFSRRGGARLYRTGDLARYLPDGSIEFLGRIDHQVKINGYRIELGEIESQLARHSNVRECVVAVCEGAAGNKRLAAYLVPNHEQDLSIDELRSFLSEKLPNYMVPAAFVVLDAMPLTPNGKLDRRALPAIDSSSPKLDEALVLPRTHIEQVLADIWAGVLKLERVGIHDNFFGLGGDSILSIKIVDRANRAGLRITPRQMFQYQTVAELASVVGATAEVESDQGVVTGPVPLTPIQHWLFEQTLSEPHHFNQAVMFELRKPLNSILLEKVVSRLIEHHDALRLRFVSEATRWPQFNSGLSEETPFSCFDLSELSQAEQRTAIEAAAAELQTSLNLERGPLMRAAQFELGEGRPERLLIIIHHLAVDGVSWRVLLEDIATGYDQLERGAAMELPQKTTSFKQWAENLAEYAQSTRLDQEEGYWLSESRMNVANLPVDYPEGVNLEASARGVSVWFGEGETLALLQDVPSVYQTQINDVLLSALALAFQGWTGGRRLLIALEGHGREEFIQGMDLSRTVGWFTSIYPVLLEVRNNTDYGEALKSIKEQMRQVSARGINYGVLRYLRDDDGLSARLKRMPQPEVLFNYFGQLDRALDKDSPFVVASEKTGWTQSPREQRRHLLEISARVLGGRLQLSFSYSENVHKRENIQRLAQFYQDALRAVIAHCQAPGAGGYTPSDFPVVKVNQTEVDKLFEDFGKIEAVYPLTPMQQGILYHSLLTPNSRVYFNQLSCRLEAHINITALKQAWDQALAAHSILRTGFVWKHSREPLQVVLPRAELRWDEQDWSALSKLEQQSRLNDYLLAEQERGFDLSLAPLMRCALIQVAQDAYIFVWSHHHLLMDGWSSSLLIKEVFELYEANRTGEELILPRDRSYTDYILWLQKQDAAKTEQFWRKTLEGFNTPTKLAIERTRKAEHADRQEDELTVVSTSAMEALQSLARQHRLTLNTIVQGAWALVLSHYSGEEDVLFGATVSGRPGEIEGIESAIGLFINTLPVRVRVNGDEWLLPWLKQLQAQQAELREYEHSPLMQVQGWSAAPRGAALFESLFIFENYPLDASVKQQGGSLRVHDVKFSEATNYGLTIQAAPGLRMPINIRYDSSRYEKESVKRMLHHFKTALEEMAARPEQKLGSVMLLDEQERRQVTVEWNATGIDYPSDACIHSLFEEQVKRTPERVAVSCDGAQLTYEQMNGRANQLAHHLRTQGVRPETLVGICVTRSLDMLVGLLGILKAGGAYVPIDPTYPKGRIGYMLKDAGIELLITEKSLVEELPETTSDIIRLDADWSTIADCSSTNPEVEISSDSLAYVIYTSGSTGKPKGVQISHRAAVNFLSSMAKEPGLTIDDVLLSVTTLSFDIAGLELYLPLTVGARVQVITRDEVYDAQCLMKRLSDSKATVMQATPSLWRMLLESGWQPDERLKMLCGGEALAADLANKLTERRASLWNLYGPTETTIWSTACKIEHKQEPISIGLPIANTQIYILNRDYQPTPVGVQGDLYIGGEGLARGYLNQPDATAEKFIPNLFGERPGERLYRTGDLARYLPDGRIEYLGRGDYQVKLRGYRIELAEIEAALNEHPAVRESVVVARTDEKGSQRLAAYYIPDKQHPPMLTDLRSFVSEKLPDYMVPAVFMALDTIPLMPNGKVNRQALPESEPVRDESEQFVAPSSEAEQLLAGIWSDLLGVEQIGIHDDFLAMGGYSLLAILIIARIREAFNIELPLRAIFESPTIARLAQTIGQARKQRQFAPPPPIERATGNGRVPLSFAQEHLWHIEKADPGRSFYNHPLALRLGRLNVAALERAINEILRRHASLRTHFAEVEAGPIQIISPPSYRHLPIVDLTELPDEQREAVARAIGLEEARRPFDLTQGPVFRACLLRLAADSYVALITMHSLVGDGFSMNLFVREVSALYDAFAKGEASPLPDLTMQYADYAIWQRNWLQGDALEEQLAFWKKQLDGIPEAINWDVGSPRRSSPTFRVAYEPFAISQALTDSLKALSRREGLTLYMTLMAALQALIYRTTGQADVVIGAPGGVRIQSEFESLIGAFVNTLPIRMNFSGEPSFRKVMRSVREAVLEAHAHQEVPMAKVVQEVLPERSFQHNPLFQVVLVAGMGDPTGRYLPSGVNVLSIDTGVSKYDLVLTLRDTEQGLSGRMAYSTDVFDVAAIRRMSAFFKELLEDIAANPDQRDSGLV